MTDLKNFDPDLSIIQSRLHKHYSIEQIKESLNLLLGQGLLSRDSSGKLKKTHAHVTNRPDIADLGSQEFHKNVSLLATFQLNVQFFPITKESL